MSLVLKMLVVQGVSVPTLPEGTVVSSRADCTSRCYFSESCLSMFFDNSTNLCHLVDTLYLNTDLVSVSDSMQYLILKGSCRSDYIWHSGLSLCYKLYGSKNNWQEAENQCIQDGGHLIKVETEALNTFMNELAKSTGDSIWIGGKKTANRTWLWVDNSAIQITFWGTGQPGDPGNVENCVMIYLPETNPVSKWHDATCHNHRRFVCQLSVLKKPCP